MSFGSDIHVFIYMGFVLVELFDEWVYSFELSQFSLLLTHHPYLPLTAQNDTVLAII